MDFDELRAQVDAIAQSVNDLQQSGISDRALVLLIQASCPLVSVSGRDRKPGTMMIRAVMDGLANLDEFVFPTEEDA